MALEPHPISIKSLLFALLILVAAVGVVVALMATQSKSSSDIRSRAAEEVTIVKSWEFTGGTPGTPKWRGYSRGNDIFDRVTYITGNDTDGAMHIDKWKYKYYPNTGPGPGDGSLGSPSISVSGTFPTPGSVNKPATPGVPLANFQQGNKYLHMRMRLVRQNSASTMDTFNFLINYNNYMLGVPYVQPLPLSLSADGQWHEYTVKFPEIGELPLYKLDFVLGGDGTGNNPPKQYGILDIDYIRLEQPK